MSPVSPPINESQASSVDRAEIAKFSAMAEAWWDLNGAFKPLHKLNPTRLQYIQDVAGHHFKLDLAKERPLTGIRILDIGCGGGLLAEPLSYLGAEVTGIDASSRNIGIARAHAEKSHAKVSYLACAAEDLVGKQSAFDLVLAMEVVEHVADLNTFVQSAGSLVKPGGLLIAATLNRTAKSFLFAIVGAEYILRWLPQGTHDWQKFVKPSELATSLRHAGLSIKELTGVTYAPFSDSWSLSKNLDVNYILVAERSL